MANITVYGGLHAADWHVPETSLYHMTNQNGYLIFDRFIYYNRCHLVELSTGT